MATALAIAAITGSHSPQRRKSAQSRPARQRQQPEHPRRAQQRAPAPHDQRAERHHEQHQRRAPRRSDRAHPCVAERGLEEVRVQLDARHEPAVGRGERRHEEVGLCGACVHVGLDVAAHQHHLVAERVGRQELVGLERLVERHVRKGVVGADVADHGARGRRSHLHEARGRRLDAVDDALPERVGHGLDVGHVAHHVVGVELHVA